MNCTFIYFSIEAEVPRRRGPATLLRRGGVEIKERVGSINALPPTRYLQWGLRGLVVADGDEIPEDLVADVGPSLEYFVGRQPIPVTDLAGAKDMAAAPASFDVFDAFEQLGGSSALSVYATHLSSVGGDIAPTTALWMAQHGEKATRDVDDLEILLICFFQDGHIAEFRRQSEHAGEGWNLTELCRVDVLEGVEVDDYATLALRDLLRQKAVPVA